MVVIQETMMFSLGVICGVFGPIEHEDQDKLHRLLDRAQCNCILFCYRGVQDDELVRVLFQYVQCHKDIRLIYVLNDKYSRKMGLDGQVASDKIISQVDMLLYSSWPLMDLPIYIAIYSNVTVVADPSAEKSIMPMLNSLHCNILTV